MSNQTPFEPASQEVPAAQEVPAIPTTTPSSTTTRTETSAAREASSTRGGGNWAAGAILILLGVIFLLQNTGAFHLENWWAVFILIPALAAFGNAWNRYRETGGRLDSAARGSIIGGLIFTTVAAIFLFGLDWGRLWPLFLIIGGLALLLNAVLPD